MKRFAIAAHGNLASGLKSTLELFTAGKYEITYINTYTEKTEDLETQIMHFITSIKKKDEVIIFTDLYGGSVNQKITLLVNEMPNVFIIAGFNVALLLELVLSSEAFSTKFINEMITKARSEMILVEKQNLISDDDFFSEMEE